MRVQDFKKMKNQKGATAAEIVVAISIIVITIGIVSMIYVNTVFESRNVTRTAGATRIVTNILENIELLSYSEFVENFDTQIVNEYEKQTTDEFLNYYKVEGGDAAKIFSTKLPKGYTIYIKNEPNYGSHNKENEQFDLVREIDMIITFNIGQKIEKIEFNTVKVREMIEETNPPSTEYLLNDGILIENMNYYPIKYLDGANAYIKVDEDDSSWYNYSNKDWATVVVSRLQEEEIFDINGKYIGETNTNRESDDYTEKFVWIPRFFITSDNSEFYEFAYLGSGVNKIVQTILSSNSAEVGTITINNYKALDEEEIENVAIDSFSNKAGKWISSETGITEDNEGKILNESKYGPYISY